MLALLAGATGMSGGELSLKLTSSLPLSAAASVAEGSLRLSLAQAGLFPSFLRGVLHGKAARAGHLQKSVSPLSYWGCVVVPIRGRSIEVYGGAALVRLVYRAPRQRRFRPIQ